MAIITTILALALCQGQSFTARRPDPVKPHTVRITVLDLQGKPAAGCPVAMSWKQAGSKVSPVDPKKTDGNGQVDFLIDDHDSLMAGKDSRLGFADWPTLAHTDKATIRLMKTSKVHLTRSFSPKLRPGEKMSTACRISPLPETPRPRPDAFYSFPKGGLELTMDGDADVWLPQGTYVATMTAPGVATTNMLRAPSNVVDLAVHWELDLVGRMAAELKPTRIQGKFTSLAALRGKWVYIDFWGTWCQPCVANMPQLFDFYEKNADKRDRFEIVTIHSRAGSEKAEYDRTIAAVKKKYWNGRDMPFPVLFDGKGEILDQWRVSSVPCAYLIDPNGRIVAGGLRELQAHLDEK